MSQTVTLEQVMNAAIVSAGFQGLESSAVEAVIGDTGATIVDGLNKRLKGSKEEPKDIKIIVAGTESPNGLYVTAVDSSHTDSSHTDSYPTLDYFMN